MDMAPGPPDPAGRLGDRRLDSASGDLMITRRPDGTLVIAIWNYAGPDERGNARIIQPHLNDGRNARPSEPITLKPRELALLESRR
jgi:hypothetical protein